jgi:hypothetical protein
MFLPSFRVSHRATQAIRVETFMNAVVHRRHPGVSKQVRREVLRERRRE